MSGPRSRSITRRVERVRVAHQAAWKKEEGFSLTYLPFIARATIDALKEYPVVNSSFFLEEKKAVFHRSVNLGIAIDLDQKGLVVATIRNADGLRLVGLARRIRELAEKARRRQARARRCHRVDFLDHQPWPLWILPLGSHHQCAQHRSSLDRDDHEAAGRGHHR